MTDPTAYGEGLGGALFIAVMFFGTIALVKAFTFVRDHLQARKRRPTTVHHLIARKATK